MDREINGGCLLHNPDKNSRTYMFKAAPRRRHLSGHERASFPRAISNALCCTDWTCA